MIRQGDHLAGDGQGVGQRQPGVVQRLHQQDAQTDADGRRRDGQVEWRDRVLPGEKGTCDQFETGVTP